MKIKRFLVVTAMFSMLAACGGSGGGSSDAAITAAINSFKDFGTVVGSAEIAACINFSTTTCTCPGGGTATVDAAASTVTLANCMSATGLSYSGTFTYNAASEEITADMTTFGECAPLSGTVSTSTSTCGGDVSGTCAGGSVNCSVVDDSAVLGECTLSC